MLPPVGNQDPGFDAAPSDGIARTELPRSESPPGSQHSLVTRLLRALANEVENLNFRVLIAGMMVSLLPDLCFCRLRTIIYRRVAGMNIGARTVIMGAMDFTETRNIRSRLRIGRNTIINKHFFADLTGNITIGDFVSIGHHTVFITADHDIGDAERRSGITVPKAIVVENGSWIGACSTILPGVTIGQSSIVTAGALVAAKVPPNKMVGGVPARVIKSLTPA